MILFMVKYYLLAALSVIFLISVISEEGISFRNFSNNGGPALLNVLLAYISGIVITPVFLPFIPGRPFSLKGFFYRSFCFYYPFATKSCRK